MTREELYQYFSRYGLIEEIDIKRSSGRGGRTCSHTFAFARSWKTCQRRGADRPASLCRYAPVLLDA